MSFGIELTKKEQALLDKHIKEILRKRDTDLSRAELNIITYKFKHDVIMPSRKDTADRRANRRASRQAAADSILSWSHTVPPRHSTKR